MIFTGSATEANNLVLRGAARKFRGVRSAPPRIVVSAIEHESVLETADDLAREGAEVVRIPVNAAGIADLKKIKESLTPETAIVSVMYANNEIGAVQPIREVANIVDDFKRKLHERPEAKDPFPLFHTDAAQALQFLDCAADELGVDIMTISSHKIYGPKGIGALYVRDLGSLAPLISGGGQEFGLRSGTENVPAMVGFAKAIDLALVAWEKESPRIAALRDRLWAGIKKIAPDARINGPENNSGKLPNILNVYFPGRTAEELITKWDLAGLAVSAGSACRARAVQPSYVIEALGYSKERANASIRFSLGRPTTAEDIEGALKTIKAAL